MEADPVTKAQFVSQQLIPCLACLVDLTWFLCVVYVKTMVKAEEQTSDDVGVSEEDKETDS